MLSGIAEAKTFEMEMRGHKQATAHSHERTKNSNPSKKFTQRQNSNSNLLDNSKKTLGNRSNRFRAALVHHVHGVHVENLNNDLRHALSGILEVQKGVRGQNGDVRQAPP